MHRMLDFLCLWVSPPEIEESTRNNWSPDSPCRSGLGVESKFDPRRGTEGRWTGGPGGPEVGCLHSICGQPPHGCYLVLQRGWTYMVFRSRKPRAARTALRPPFHTGHRIGGSPIRVSRGGHG